MKFLSNERVIKSLVSGVILSSVVGLTACQNMPNMPMSQHHDAKGMPHANMSHSQLKNEHLSEGQILKVLSVANMGEIMQAQVAMPNLQTAQARSYAQGMIDQHTDNENKGRALANSLGLPPQASHTSNALQVDSNNLVTKLSKAAKPADKEYIMGQIMVHDKVLMTIDSQLMPSAKTPELRQFLAQTRAAVAMHLDMAKKLDATM